jgi:hypothetical protein
LDDEGDGDESDDGLVDTETGISEGRTMHERMTDHINMLQDFTNGLKYQRQFND